MYFLHTHDVDAAVLHELLHLCGSGDFRVFVYLGQKTMGIVRGIGMHPCFRHRNYLGVVYGRGIHGVAVDSTSRFLLVNQISNGVGTDVGLFAACMCFGSCDRRFRIPCRPQLRLLELATS